MHRAVIKGRVQMVGFRATTKVIADRKGLQGTVRNLDDGSVEIILSGPRADLEQLIHDVGQKLPQGTIREIIIESYHETSSIEGFSIQRV